MSAHQEITPQVHVKFLEQSPPDVFAHRTMYEQSAIAIHGNQATYSIYQFFALLTSLKDHITFLLILDFHVLSHLDRKSTRLNSSHVSISYAVFCLKKKIDRKYNK